MHTVEQLREAFAAAERLGYKVRLENLTGTSGGACVIAGRKHLFVELALSPDEQLSVVLDALRSERVADGDPSLDRLLSQRIAA